MFGLVEAEKANYPITVLCRTLGVSPAGFYGWRHAQTHPCPRRVGDAELVERIREIHRTSRRSYGSPRIHDELVLGEGRRVGRKRIERLMRINGIVGIHKRRRGCTRRDPDATSSDDLVKRQFTPEGPDRLWVSDVTEHPTGEGKVYLAVVVDAWSRRVIGWSIADHMRAELVVDALQMAIWRRRPPAGQTVHHSDHGSQGGLNGCSGRWARSATPTTVSMIHRPGGCRRRHWSGASRWRPDPCFRLTETCPGVDLSVVACWLNHQAPAGRMGSDRIGACANTTRHSPVLPSGQPANRQTKEATP